jgi:hypothetical protein
MTPTSHIFRQFAAVLALVMITSVALPIVASACESMRDACPMAAQEPATPPCHGDPAGDEPPAGDDALALCCAPALAGLLDDATLAERDDLAPAALLASSELRFPSPAAVPAAHSAMHAAETPPAAGGLGLQVLFRALLN